MDKFKLCIKDTLFSHAFSSSNWFRPTYFDWDFNNENCDVIYLTDDYVDKVSNFNNKIKIAWLVESPLIKPYANEFVFNNGHLFNKIYTHNSKILEKYLNSYFVPAGGCHLQENEIKIYENKNKLISIMCSNKTQTSGHLLRHEIIKKFNDIEYFDIYGTGYGEWKEKSVSTIDYKFSIVIENINSDFYFTEKLIDVLLSGTIPIYWGCPSISKFFNTDSFLIFNNIDELEELIKNEKFLNEFYDSNKQNIIDNFEKALSFKIAEDYLYNEYLK